MRRVAVLVALILTACGGGTKPSSETLPGADHGAAASSAASPSALAAATDAPTATASASPATAAPSARASGSSVQASLAEPCRQRGETQVLTVIGLKAGEVTGYSTQYSDGSNELTNKEYTGGYGSGVAGPDGRYSTTWAVPQAAPAGRADVLVIWGSGSEPLRVSFTIPAHGQGC